MAVNVAELEKDRYRAMREADIATLDALLDESLTYVHSSGASDSKEAILEGIRSRRWIFTKVELLTQVVRQYEASAVVTGEVRFDIEVGGALRKLHSHYTDIWVQRGGSWKMVAWQATAAAPKTPPA